MCSCARFRTEAVTRATPWFGELPWVGTFFRRVRDERNDIELLITVTPEIVDEVESRFGATVREAYGMTEIGPCMQVYLKDGNRAAIGTCGELSPTYEARIVDASDR